jgi:hypothetical protein
MTEDEMNKERAALRARLPIGVVNLLHLFADAHFEAGEHRNGDSDESYDEMHLTCVKAELELLRLLVTQSPRDRVADALEQIAAHLAPKVYYHSVMDPTQWPECDPLPIRVSVADTKPGPKC